MCSHSALKLLKFSPPLVLQLEWMLIDEFSDVSDTQWTFLTFISAVTTCCLLNSWALKCHSVWQTIHFWLMIQSVFWHWEDCYTSVFSGFISSYLTSKLMKHQEIKEFELFFVWSLITTLASSSDSGWIMGNDWRPKVIDCVTKTNNYKFAVKGKQTREFHHTFELIIHNLQVVRCWQNEKKSEQWSFTTFPMTLCLQASKVTPKTTEAL